MLKKITALILFSISFSSLTFAQEKMVLTLEKSVDIALERNPEFQASKKEVAKAQASIWEAYSTILPQLNANANFQKSWIIQQNTIPNFLKPMLEPLAPIFPEVKQMPDFVRLSFGLENTLMYGATVTQPLFLGGAGIAGIKMAYAAKRALEDDFARMRQNLVYETANTFYACILTKEMIAVQEEALEQADENLAVVTKKYNVGTASGFDKMRAEVEVSNIKPQVIAVRNNYQSALTGLRTVLGLEANTDIEIEGELSFMPDDFGDMTLAEIQGLAVKNRPELQVIEEQKYISKNGITIAKSNFLPKVFFQTDYSFLAMKNDYHFAQGDFSEGFTSAISLQLPLFQGFKSTKQYQKAKLDYNIMLDTEKQVLNGIAAEAEIAYNKFQEAEQNYVSAKESVQLATEALRLANVMYNEGASTQLDVLGARLALTRSQLNYISLLYEYQMARYQLRRATGTLQEIIS